MPTDALQIRPLNADTLPAWLQFFDHEAFVDNPRWGACYCQYMLVDHGQVKWSERTAEQNRAAGCARVAQGRMQGLLAWRGDRVVGWCHVAPRALMDSLADEPEPDAAQLGTIACFVVAPDQRRTGVARALLAAACDHLRAQGCRVAEALPQADAQSAAQHHHGPLALYLSEGFTEHRRDADGTVFVRKALA
jgi:GNAT superfamily N-acetyltransferase